MQSMMKILPKMRFAAAKQGSGGTRLITSCLIIVSIITIVVTTVVVSI